MDALKAFNQQVNERFDQLTKSGKKIAAYLVRNYEEAAFLSAADLAKRLDISEKLDFGLAENIAAGG